MYSFEPSIPKSFKFSEPDPAPQKPSKNEPVISVNDELDFITDEYTHYSPNDDQLIPVDIPDIGDITRTRKQSTPSAAWEKRHKLEDIALEWDKDHHTSFGKHVYEPKR